MLQFIFAALLFFSFLTKLFAQSASLVEAAKKEGGKVVAYGSLESEEFDAVKAGFEKKTGLELEYWRASGTKTMDRAVSEYRSGRPLYDAVLLNANVARLVAKQGILAKYDSPSAAQFAKEAIDPVLGPSYRM
jgi:spermidine/putrescine-binding protein